jgi:hypothetical protein
LDEVVKNELTSLYEHLCEEHSDTWIECIFGPQIQIPFIYSISEFTGIRFFELFLLEGETIMVRIIVNMLKLQE